MFKNTPPPHNFLTFGQEGKNVYIYTAKMGAVDTVGCGGLGSRMFGGRFRGGFGRGGPKFFLGNLSFRVLYYV
jgi:hypothetical protein